MSAKRRTKKRLSKKRLSKRTKKRLSKRTGKPYDLTTQPRHFHRRTIGFSADEDTLIRKGAVVEGCDVASFIRGSACSKARRIVAA